MSDRSPLTTLYPANLAALIMANFNSIVLDYAARTAIGGTDLSYFYLKQFPVLAPEKYLEKSSCGLPWVEWIVPRVLELTYTSEEMRGFAEELGYQGDPFPWDEHRRHNLQSELDAIFAHMYGLTRADLEWILDAESPSVSFPSLKQNEIRKFGEYRTQRLVLQVFDSLASGLYPSASSQ